jgi:hypothetical protein
MQFFVVAINLCLCVLDRRYILVRPSMSIWLEKWMLHGTESYVLEPEEAPLLPSA